MPLSAKYYDAEVFSDGLAPVEDAENEKWGLIDKNGDVIIPPKYDEIDTFEEGITKVRIGNYPTGKYGLIDKMGKEIVSPKYDDIDSFSEGLAKVRIGDYSNGRYGLIDSSGREVVPPKYSRIDDFNGGFATVKIEGGKWGVIDKYGRVVIPPIYDGYVIRNNGQVLLQIREKWGFGLFDPTGKSSIGTKYDDIWCILFEDSGIYGVKLNGKKGYADVFGNEFFDF